MDRPGFGWIGYRQEPRKSAGFERCWIYAEKWMVPGDGVEPPTLRFSVAVSGC